MSKTPEKTGIDKKHETAERPLTGPERFSRWVDQKLDQLDAINARLDQDIKDEEAQRKRNAAEQKALREQMQKDFEREQLESNIAFHARLKELEQDRLKRQLESDARKRAEDEKFEKEMAEIEAENKKKGPIYETLYGLLFFYVILKIGGYLYDKYF